MSTTADSHHSNIADSGGLLPGTGLFRTIGWVSVFFALAYVINNFLCFWLGWPGVVPLLATLGLMSGPGVTPAAGIGIGLAAVQTALYGAAFVVSAVMVNASTGRTLRDDAGRMARIANFIIRAAFWAVLMIGIADAIISFLRVEGLLEVTMGSDLATELGRSRFRGPYVHFPLLLLAIVIAVRTPKALGFHWLALMVVVAEIFIVLSRFVFSYEQAFQGDLVRFWYGALFLFASAYTLFEDGHVRVDVLYAGFADKTKARINAIGSVVLGLTMCWTILVFGMWSQSSIINSPLLAYEVSQSGFGMYVKYWMAGFLAVFAVTMIIQFTSLMLESIANYRQEPGARETVASTTA